VLLIIFLIYSPVTTWVPLLNVYQKVKQSFRMASLRPTQADTLPPLDFRDDSIKLVSEALLTMDMKTLKAVISGARATSFTLDSSSGLFSRTTSPLLFHLKSNMKLSKETTREYLQAFNYLAHPLTSSFLINLALAKEPRIDEIDAEKFMSFINELTVNEMSRRPPRINWKPIFQEKFISDPIVSTLPPNTRAHREIFNILDRLRNDMTGKTLIPYGSTKGVSSISQDHARDIYLRDEEKTYKAHFSAHDLVVGFLRNEEIPPGPAQVKQKWYHHGLKPRTYYAQGGTALFVSMHLRSFFNELADRFEYTNRFARVDASRIVVPDPNSNNLMVYDFSNFTSNFSEQYYFLSHLADFMEGIEVYLLQSELRVIAADLGSLIRLYRDFANDHPEYYWEDGFLGYKTQVLSQCQAGFLGVYGNLMTCTVPHGLVARETVEDSSSVGCAGDDGIINPPEKKPAINTLLLIGEFAAEKIHHGPWVYLKRRLLFSENGQLKLTDFPQYPTLSFLSARYNQMSSRFGYLKHKEWADFRYSLYCSIKSFLRSLPKAIQECDSSMHRQTICSIVNELIVYGQFVPDGETKRLHFATSKGDKFGPPLLMVEPEMLESLSRYPYFSSTRLVKRRVRRDIPSGVLFDGLESDNVYELNGSVYVNVLKMSGYIEECDPLDEDYEWVRDCDLEKFSQSGQEVTRYRCIKTVAGDVIETLFRRPLEKLHKRKMAYSEFVELASSNRVASRFGRSKGGYFDHDWVNEDDVFLSYEDVADEDIFEEPYDPELYIEESDFRERVSGIMF